MRGAKIKPSVISVWTGNRMLTDKNKVYTEFDFPHGKFKELIKGGFLIEVNNEEKKAPVQNDFAKDHLNKLRKRK